MKNLFASLTLAFFALLIPAIVFSDNLLVGTIQPASSERIAVLTRDRASVNLGTKHGLVKGDIGIISSDPSKRPDSVIGKCSITSTGFDASICEVISAKKEIEKGNYVLFEPISFADGNFYSAAMNTIATVLDPYEPYVHPAVCVYGFFDETNAVTGLSDEIDKEFRSVFAQKPRLKLMDKSVLKGLVLYPDASGDLLGFTRNEMRKNRIDVLILGKYAIVDGKVRLTVTKIDNNYGDKQIAFTFPQQPRYADSASKILLSARETTKGRTIPCNVVLRTTPKQLTRDERAQLIAFEAAGDPLVMRLLRNLDFDLIAPVQIKTTIDEQTFTPNKQGTALMLSTGNHSLTTSFRRGYFFNETLLFTSEHETTKQAILDLSKEKGLVIELGIDAASLQQPVGLRVYHPTQRHQQTLKPIHNVESDKTVEMFKD